jgi:hypothetical protein
MIDEGECGWKDEKGPKGKREKATKKRERKT